MYNVNIYLRIWFTKDGMNQNELIGKRQFYMENLLFFNDKIVNTLVYLRRHLETQNELYDEIYKNERSLVQMYAKLTFFQRLVIVYPLPMTCKSLQKFFAP